MSLTPCYQSWIGLGLVGFKIHVMDMKAHIIRRCYCYPLGWWALRFQRHLPPERGTYRGARSVVQCSLIGAQEPYPTKLVHVDRGSQSVSRVGLDPSRALRAAFAVANRASEGLEKSVSESFGMRDATGEGKFCYRSHVARSPVHAAALFTSRFV